MSSTGPEAMGDDQQPTAEQANGLSPIDTKKSKKTKRKKPKERLSGANKESLNKLS